MLRTQNLIAENAGREMYDMKMRGTKCQEWKMPEMKMKFQS